MPKGKTRSKSKIKSKSKDRLWIQEAHFKKGSLRAYVRREWGAAGFNEDGTIQLGVIRKIDRGSPTPKGHRPSLTTRRRANAALTLKKMTNKRTHPFVIKDKKTGVVISKRFKKKDAAKAWIFDRIPKAEWENMEVVRA